MKQSNTEIWNIWELIAIKYLQKHNYEILDTNFKFGRFWEIDIIAKKDSKIIFIEVKYRNNLAYWLPEEAITKYKLSKCKKTIDFYLAKNQYDFENIRFDAITILKKEKSYKITHYRNIEI